MEIVHGQRLVDAFRIECDKIKKRLWIAVPYIGNLDSIRRILGIRWLHKPNVSFRLITDVNELSNFNSDTIDFFESVGEIRHLVGLHAKIYIMDQACLITSANLTSTAFTKRHEIGVIFRGKESYEAIRVFLKMWETGTAAELGKINSIVRKRNSSDDEKAGVRYPKLWELPDKVLEINYWLKPIGSTESPITEDRSFGKSKQYLHFSKRRPKSVKPGDILIGYGIGAKRILSVFRVNSEPLHMEEEEFKEVWQRRWPWYVSAKNLTKQFGKDWVKHNLYASELVQEYRKVYPEGFITKVGGKTLGALNYKHDKINLNTRFARFIIKKVQDLQG